MSEKTIAFIVPWYGDDIRGGAESECNFLAHSFVEAGYPVEVFTSCVKEAAADRGKNTIKAGTYIESGVTVRRFRVRENRNIDLYNQSNLRIYHNNGFSSEDERVYLEEDINSPDMYAYIESHFADYRAFIFIPYLYGICYNGSSYCKGKSIMIPCLHDESYAYMGMLKEKMNEFKGLIYLSEPESELADRLYGLEHVNKAVLGAGVETGWEDSCNKEDFCKKYGIKENFILYAGRKDAGKKADELILFYLRYIKETGSSLKLVLLGGGELPVEIPEEYKDDVIDLGFVSVEDKHNAYAACSIFCNPSHFESFSIVIMEAWLAKKPILVSEVCKVTTNFAKVSNGGLWYDTYEVFRECIKYFEEHPQVCKEMGENGYDYVMNHFTKEKIVSNYIEFLEKCNL